MGKNKKIETSYNFTAAKAAAYLRNLADQLDLGKIDVEEAEIDLSDEVEVKESIKRKTNKRSIKIKVKMSAQPPEPEMDDSEIDEHEADEQESADRAAEEGAPAQDPEAAPDQATAEPMDDEPGEDPVAEPEPAPAEQVRRPAYKRLKKSMADSYKAIKAARRQGVEPDQALMEEFDGQCRLMTSYPDKGEPYYDDFAKATDQLAGAFTKGDLAGIDAAILEMDRLRKNCHRRFK